MSELVCLCTGVLKGREGRERERERDREGERKGRGREKMREGE